MVIGGPGRGAVASPNQALLLKDVPVASGGLAGLIAQVDWRMGTAMGLAAVLSVYVDVVSHRGDHLTSPSVSGFGWGRAGFG
jgi:hypothetical protein